MRSPRARVLVLHGGADRPWLAGVYRWLAAWNSTMDASRLARALTLRLENDGVAVWKLRHRLPFWDDGEPPAPVQEATEALDLVANRQGNLPTVLVGHSMGGRTAVAAAGHETVCGVVGLAPWLPADDSVAPITGKHFRVAHGVMDSSCPFSSMQAFLDRAGAVVVDSRQPECIRWDGHWLWRMDRWAAFAADAVLDMVDAHVRAH